MRTFIISTLALLALALAPYKASAQEQKTGSHRYAVVSLSVNYMREQPEYEAENGDQTLMGTVVEIIDEQSYWRRIVSPEPYKAWVNEMGLVEMSEEQTAAYIASPKYICTADYSHIYKSPDARSTRLSDFVMGGLLRIAFDAKGRALKKGRFLGAMLPSGETGWVPKEDVEPFTAWNASRDASGESIVRTAMGFLGVPYMWGGTSIKGVDCSGLALCAYYMNGILLPRNASQQARAGEDVSLDALEKGDLLFFGTPATDGKPERVSHVGIYIGDGLYIHSSQKVRISSLDKSSADYAGRDPLRARRMLGHVDDGSGVTSMSKSPFYFAQ